MAGSANSNMETVTRDRLQDKRPPFYRIEHALLELGLKPNAIAVYNVLARHADQSRRCFPSVRRMAQVLHIGTTTVRRALQDLLAAKAIRVSARIDSHGDRTSNLYELLLLTRGGWSATDPPVSPTAHGGPPQTHGWSATDTEVEPFEEEPLKGGRSIPPVPDPLLEIFSEGFSQRYGHRPTFKKKNLGEWNSLRRTHPENLLRAKIAAWWDHPLRRTFQGNRTFGAFLHWFDDISTDDGGLAKGRVVIREEQIAAMQAGTPEGHRHYHEITGGITDDNAKIRTLIAERVADDPADARAIIAACDPASH